MGKGDKRSRRGKIFAGSFGKTRQKPKKEVFAPREATPAVEKPAKKRAVKRVPAAPAEAVAPAEPAEPAAPAPEATE
jgi:30S ribosomal protein S31